MSRPMLDHGAVLDAIYAAAVSPELWAETLTSLADHVGAIGGMVAYTAPIGQRSFIMIGRLREDLAVTYNQHYARNPYSQALGKVEPGRVYIANRLIDYAGVRRSAFYADILAPQKIVGQIAQPLASLTRNGSSGGVAFMLASGDDDDARRSAARFARLAPHLTRAVDLTLQFGRHHSGASQVERLLDAMPGGAVLLDKRGLIIRTNAAAEALLSESDGIRANGADGLRLTAQLGVEARLLAARIAETLAAAEGEDRGLEGAMRVTRPSGRPSLLVLLTPLPPAAFSLWEAVDGGARALVQIVDLHRPSSAQAEILRGTAGLTEAETRVAALVGGGMTAAEAAATLGVSLNTVKTHLTRCFDKTGVRSQVALARLVASIPVPGLRAEPDGLFE